MYCPFAPEPVEETPTSKSPEEATQIVTTSLELNEEQKKVLFEQLDKLDLDPLMVLKVRKTWVAPLNVTADEVLDDIANWRSPNVRRDHWPGAHRWLFHFRDIKEITFCHIDIRDRHPYCFGVSPNFVNRGIIAPPGGNVFADVWIVNKVAAKDDDAFEYPFFMW